MVPAYYGVLETAQTAATCGAEAVKRFNRQYTEHDFVNKITTVCI